MGLIVKTPTDSPSTRQRHWDETPAGQRNDEPLNPSDQPGLFAGGIVVDGGQMVESGDLQKPERLELEQVAAMAVSSWRLLGDASNPAIARVEVPEAPPHRRWRRAVTFDGDVAYVAFVEPDLSKEEFEAVGRQRLKHREPAPRKQGGV